ncbi:DUF1003 domain-containing protein [Candidatus Woesearchaeota archaeon]|nr:DUF1003 domain-containing protein [Candidatus Woesearchaeota archaeon]
MVKKKETPKTSSNDSSKLSNSNNIHPIKHDNHPRFRQELTFGQKAADFIATFGGSWTFVISLSLILIFWMIINVILYAKYQSTFDKYPFILLNLVLSTLAAFQAPIILMAQGRQGEHDRIDANYDHAINRKAERENRKMMQDLEYIKQKLKKLSK